MEFIKCQPEHFGQVNAFYRAVVRRLEETVNYPFWSDDHPSAESIRQAIDNGELYACMDGDTVAGALILSENPEGDYEAGRWSRDLRRGEYLTIHVLATHPACARRGVGSFMLDRCVSVARRGGYKAIRLDVVPVNPPAVALYRKNGYTCAGRWDIKRNIPEIPVFDLYELNL